MLSSRITASLGHLVRSLLVSSIRCAGAVVLPLGFGKGRKLGNGLLGGEVGAQAFAVPTDRRLGVIATATLATRVTPHPPSDESDAGKDSILDRRTFLGAASSLGSLLLVSGLGHPTRAIAANGTGEAPASPITANRKPGTARRPILVFDVNETLLDLNAMRPHFQRAFGDARALDQWFSLLLHYSLVVDAADAYTDFGTVGRATLDMLRQKRRVALSPADQNSILQAILTLPPHPEVSDSLQRLRAAGFHMVTLTNSSSAAVKAQLQHAGLTRYFDESISVDSARRFKPDREAYRWAAAHLGAEPAELRLIAAHAWDVFGAMTAGWKAAFIARNDNPLLPLGPEPDLIAPDLHGVADALLTLHSARSPRVNSLHPGVYRPAHADPQFVNYRMHPSEHGS